MERLLSNWYWKVAAGVLAVIILIGENSPDLIDVNEMKDVGFELATPLYKFLKESPILFWWILLLDTIFVFLCGLFIIYQFLFKNRIRFGMQVMTMYLIRTLSMRLFYLPVPKEVLWHFPGFPSYVCSDFFFSGHVALTVMTGMFLYELDWKFLGFFVGYICNFAQIVLFMATRAHYTADCITGLGVGMAIVASWRYFGFDKVDSDVKTKSEDKKINHQTHKSSKLKKSE